MKISPVYYSHDWNDLNLTTSYSKDWDKASAIVKDRIYGRFLAQLSILEDNLDPEIWEYSGFTIIAIDCLVIETLNQFYLGKRSTHGTVENAFVYFFTNSAFFKNDFDINKAKLFYRHIRCGLLHQAQTKRETLINFKNAQMVKYVDDNSKSKGIIINRKLFHKALVNEFNEYIKKLKTNSSDFNTLRNNCIKKMKTIAI